MNIAFFDFDGTITDRDSLPHFIKFAVGQRRYYWGLLVLAPMLVLYLFKIIPNQQAKEKLLGHYFAGWQVDRFQAVADEYSLSEIDKIIRPLALERIGLHQQNGDEVCLVSASMENWLQAWCADKGIQLIATKLDIVDGRLNGKFVGNNCYGTEKVVRIKQKYNLQDYEDIYAYGDSQGDAQMLEIATIKAMKPFRD